MIKIAKLLCDHREEPIGIDNPEPTFSWKILSDERNIEQESYQIQISLTPDFEQMIWNVTTFSENSIAIKYTGSSLKSFTTYFFRVRIWVVSGECSEWSSSSFFETGFLNDSSWSADWIRPSTRNISEYFKVRQPFSCFKDFTLRKKLQKAIVYVSSLGLYELELNGKKIGDAFLTPGWTDYYSNLQYQTYDVTNDLKVNNRIEATVSEGWYSGYLGWEKGKDSYGNINALILEIHLYFIDGSKEIVRTDESWCEQTCKVLSADIYNGSYINYLIDKKKLGQMCLYNYSKENLIAQQNEPVKKIGELLPKSLFVAPNGDLILDMGQNMVGWIEIDSKNLLDNQIILTHAEVLDQEGNIYFGNLRHAAQKSIYEFASYSEDVLHPKFTFYGFRYVKLEGFPKNVDLSWFKGIVVHSDMQEIGKFETSNELINQLQSNILWGQKGNFVDLPTDCPQRDERLGWTADAQVFCRTANFNMNTHLFFTKWLHDMRENQMEDGSIPLVVPDVVRGQYFMTEEGNKILKTAAAWGDAIVICPWMVYQSFGDTEILSENYDAMKKWIGYILRQGKDPYLWDSSVQLGDWLALDYKEDSLFGATDESLVATAFYAYSTYLVSCIAKILNQYTDFLIYKELYEKIKSRFQEKFFQETNYVYQTQTSHVLALYFDLVPENEKLKLINSLISLISKNNNHLNTGFVGTPYLCHVLSENGHHDIALKLLHQTDYPSWLYQVKNGATTMWEHWDGIKEDGSFWSDSMNSFNHYSYGAVGDWLYKYIGGISYLEPGYRKSKIAPVVGKMFRFADSSIETMYGELSCKWFREANKVNFDVKIPTNTTSVIYLHQVKNFQKLKLTLERRYGVTDFKVKQGDVEFQLGSGEYRFDYEMTELH